MRYLAVLLCLAVSVPTFAEPKAPSKKPAPNASVKAAPKIQSFSANSAGVLKGVQPAMYVDFIFQMDKVAKENLEANAVRTDVELRLRKAGIRVYDRNNLEPVADRAALNESPCLVIFLMCTDMLGDDDEYLNWSVYDVRVELREPVVVGRKSTKIEVRQATVYQKSMVGYASKSGLASTKDVIGGQVDVFLNDYLKVNPSPRPVDE